MALKEVFRSSSTHFMLGEGQAAKSMQKKGLILRPTLKGSLNLMVTKGPEETTS